MAKILCIEDEEFLRLDISEELADAGYDVVTAVNGAQGLEAILSEEPDLVVSDITMPVMDGYQLIKTLRQDYSEFDDMPFIFLSALADKNSILRGMEIGSDDYMTKPIDYEMLLAKVEVRLREKTRMLLKKQKEHLKLYQSMSDQQQENVQDINPEICTDKPGKIVIVGESDNSLWRFHHLMSDIGHDVSVITSGESYLKKAKSFKQHVVCFWHKTDDLDVTAMLEKIVPSKNNSYVLMIPEGSNSVLNSLIGNERLEMISDVISLPCSDSDLAKIIYRLVQEFSAV